MNQGGNRGQTSRKHQAAGDRVSWTVKILPDDRHLRSCGDHNRHSDRGPPCNVSFSVDRPRNTLMFKVRVPNVPLVPRQSREDAPQAPRRVGRGVGAVTAGRSGGLRRALVWATAFYKYLATFPHPPEPRRRDERATYSVIRKAREGMGRCGTAWRTLTPLWRRQR
jgi:hypothetical protein